MTSRKIVRMRSCPLNINTGILNTFDKKGFEFIMSVDSVRKYLKEFGLDDKVKEFEMSSATVELAAAALSCEPKRIAKTLSFLVNEQAILIVAAGDARIDNPKYKAQFGVKAKMIAAEDVEPMIGHGIGGVCPFGINEGVTVYLDESLKRFTTVYPACGSGNSAIELTIPQLEQYSGYTAWVDVCKDRTQEPQVLRKYSENHSLR